MAEVKVSLPSKRGNRLSVMKTSIDTGSSKLDLEVARRLKAADINHDGELSQDEIVTVVKDLVIEHRSTGRARIVAALTFLLLLISLFGNFALMIWGNELTKESHVGGQASGEEVGGSTGGDSSYSRRSRFLHDISASFDPANAIKPPPLAMTSTDGKRIIGTKEAMKTMPMSVTPVMMKAELEKAKEITYEVADLDQEGEETKDFAERIMSNGRMLWGASRRSPQGRGGPNRVKTKTMKVKSVEQLSPTHAKFLGEEGEEVEVKDGQVLATESVPMSKLWNNPSLRGSSIDPKEIVTAPSEARLKNGDRIPVKPDAIEARTAKLKQPVCGASLSVPSDNTDAAAEVDELRMRMVEELDKRGVDVQDLKDKILKRRRRRLQAGGDPNAPYTGEDLLPDPGVFADGCSSPVKTVLGPTLASVADQMKQINEEKKARDADREAMAEKMRARIKARYGDANAAANAAAGAGADDVEEPERYACTDSTLGCKPIKLELDADGKLADLIDGMPKMGKLGAGGAGGVGGAGSGIKPKRMEELFVSERIGGDGGSNVETFLADEGICGMRTMGKDDTPQGENVNIGAIAFKPCKEGADFSKPLGVKGRALELATQANEPERMKRSAFSVRDAAEWSERAALRAEEAAREAKEALAQAKARGATDAQAAEQAFMERFQKNQRKFDGTEGLNRIWADDGELPLSGFKARQGDVVDALQMTRNLKYDDDYLGADGAGAAADPADQFAKFYDANPEMGAKIKDAMDQRPTRGDAAGVPFPPKRRPRNRGELGRRLSDGNVTEVEPVATLGTRLVGAIVKSDGHLKSISFIYKDDCAEMVEDLEEYELCKDRVKRAHCNLRDPALPADPLTNKCTYGSTEEGLKAAARRRR